MSEVSCVFCQIVSRDLPSSIVYEDEDVLGFMDIQPATTGHVLIIPKRHSTGLNDLDEHTGAAMFGAAQRIAAAMRRSNITCEGVNFFLADGEAAFQEVFHTHLHVVPRSTDDGLKLEASWSEPARHELDELASHIHAHVSATRSTNN
ncbi:HIT family protein [Demequina zhanjiangensis]|uniref:HIT domain-containing protein n=1 Tax=Demequina zhanjiangensis TaxID=3051659 RepID=A0ABT8G3I2_9MICO|nr:HIT domain-containing protein [Demequina sp. SYSU T00b26]MDN4473714.1 HIT domain-containing protein [Demequina sp. SYSU T00b26]